MFDKLQEQLKSTIPDKREQLRMLAIGAILNAEYAKGGNVSAAYVVQEADKMAGELEDEIKKL